jgi:hypothetical protein
MRFRPANSRKKEEKDMTNLGHLNKQIEELDYDEQRDVAAYLLGAVSSYVDKATWERCVADAILSATRSRRNTEPK